MAEKIKILLADDESDFRQIISLWLQSQGYSVRDVSNGESLIQSMKEEKPDVVFLDLNMPGMSTEEVIKNARELSQEIPIIVLSAYIDDEIIKRMESFRISGVFYKGDDLGKISSLLESVLRK